MSTDQTGYTLLKSPTGVKWSDPAILLFVSIGAGLMTFMSGLVTEILVVTNRASLAARVQQSGNSMCATYHQRLRCGNWQGEKTTFNPIVWILHTCVWPWPNYIQSPHINHSSTAQGQRQLLTKQRNPSKMLNLSKMLHPSKTIV